MTLLLAFLLAVPAAAHQQKVTITSVSHNARTGMLEIVHRVPLHDAEHALRSQGTKAVDIVDNSESRRAFADYVSKRFELSVKDRPVDLKTVGSEIEGGNLFVYQEAKSPGRGVELAVRSQILSDVWSRQENRVNLGAGSRVNTLIFKAGDRHKYATLP